MHLVIATNSHVQVVIINLKVYKRSNFHTERDYCNTKHMRERVLKDCWKHAPYRAATYNDK